MTDMLNDRTATFRARFGGDVLTDADDGYDAARSLWNGACDRRPALIARCESTRDVAEAVAFGRAEGLEISVRGGAHNVWGASVVNDGLMIDLSRMHQVAVDPASRRAVCSGGATMADLDAATQAHGLAVTGGVISHTGVGGLTLGGGLGWLLRPHGLAVDNLLAAEVVLADGRVVRASAERHPDLFWALRGGGGNFGIVTAFEFQLHPVGPEVHVGLFFWKLDRAVEALRLCRDVIEALPREANALVAAGLSAPPAPFVPEQYHFTPGCALIIAGFSSGEEHERLLQPIRAELPPLFEFVTPIPYVELQKLLDESAPWGIHAYSKALYLDELSDHAIDTIAEHLPRKSSPMSFCPIFALGGAYRDTLDDDTAFGGTRDARYVFSIDAVAPTVELWEADRAWVRSLWDAMRPCSANGGGYVNFMGEDDEDRVRETYGRAKYERLARTKAAYDPDNVFHLNANIKAAPRGEPESETAPVPG